jgi:CubicO group peptidase (beta-lactamase class C family)
VNRFISPLIIVLAVVVLGQRTAAQVPLTYSLFERYLESFRAQAGIPGMSALVLNDGVIVWENGFGRQDLERGIDARADTPYLISTMSQTVGATLLLKKCIDEDARSLNDPVSAWEPGTPQPASLAQLLAHVAPTGLFEYDPGRFAALTPVAEACAGMPYGRLLEEEIFSRLGMAASVPGTALATPTPEDLETFGAASLARYAAVLNRVAAPYRLDSRGRPTRTVLPPGRADASTGIVTTALDLARFDATLRHDILLRPLTRQAAWTQAAAHLPTGLGWFVQSYNGQPVVWQFGQIEDAYSSLIVKLPNRGLTFILLANSDGLTAPFALDKGDVTTSIFARLFLRVHVP